MQKNTLYVLLTLYLAQGLPIGFITQALPAILREYNVSLTDIGWTGLLLAPWVFKFLWSPLVDRYYVKKIGQSKTWVLPMQIGSALLLLAISFLNPDNFMTDTAQSTLKLLCILLFFVNLCGATHDIATDALATRSLTKSNLSKGNATQVIGHRLGLIIGGGVFLMSIDYLGWQISFIALALLIMLNTLPILLHKEPHWQYTQVESQQKTQNIRLWFKEQFGYFWHSKEMRAWLFVLCCFKISDGLSSGMVKPMMTDMGVSLAEIGLWGSVLGSAASLVGATLAAVVMQHIKRWHALLWFSVLQSLTTGLYAVLAHSFEQDRAFAVWTLYAVNAIEHAAAAMALVAMLSTIMSYAREKFAGSDFTFQVCILTLISGSTHILSGYIADNMGYTQLFSMSVLLGLLAVIPIWLWHKARSRHWA